MILFVFNGITRQRSDGLIHKCYDDFRYFHF